MNRKFVSYELCGIFIFLICLAFGSICKAEEPTDVYALHGFWGKQPKIAPLEPSDFAIMPWGWSPGDAKALKDVKDCGFNLAGFVTPENVKYCEKLGLKCFVDDYRVSNAVGNLNISQKEIEKLVHEAVMPFKRNPVVYGYYLKDEPLPTEFVSLARWREAFAKEDPKAVAYFNLLPMGDSNDGPQYYKTFADMAKPAFLSYDHYTLMDDGNMSPTFFSNLEMVRKASLEHNIPFWNIILGNSHYRYQAGATVGGMSLQVYSTLAYGGRGVSYFTYFAPYIVNYRDSAVDQFLNKTPTWDVIRNLNMQIHQLAPTLTKLRSVNVFHHPNVPAKCSGIETSRYLSAVNSGNLLVGEFQGPAGSEYVLLVNKDLNKSTYFDVTFKDKDKEELMMTNPFTGITDRCGASNGWLAPGQGILLSLKQK